MAKSLIKELLTRQVDQIYPSLEALEKVLASGRKLTVYWGIDPTGPDLHIEHAVNLFILRRFQRLGHKVIVLFGDFTARIGDPSGRTKKRIPLTAGQVAKNLKNYKNQVFKILDSKKTLFRWNSEWWEEMSASRLLGLGDLITHQQLIERQMFQKRIKEGNPISLKELQYPILQGYDSVALRTDVEVGGTDQLFNMMVGRELEKTILKKEKFIMTKPILTNPLTGQILMSKTSGNYIAISAKPDQMFGQVMALPDEVIFDCFNLYLDLPESELAKVKKELKSGANPRDLKIRLAFEIVKLYWGELPARRAQEEFERVFTRRLLPRNLEIRQIKLGHYFLADLLVSLKLAVSKSEARRLIRGRGVRIGGQVQKSERREVEVKSGMVFQVGKRKFIKIK